MGRSGLGPHFAFGIAVAALVFVADQTTKLLVLYTLELRPGDRLILAPFADFVLTMNPGISYGLFPQESELGRWFLVALKVGAAILFTFWMGKTASRLGAASFALLVGGALGNAVDRALYGAVVDFVSLHALGWRWYVFNLADTAIVAGVAGLLYDTLMRGATKSPPSDGS